MLKILKERRCFIKHLLRHHVIVAALVIILCISLASCGAISQVNRELPNKQVFRQTFKTAPDSIPEEKNIVETDGMYMTYGLYTSEGRIIDEGTDIGNNQEQYFFYIKNHMLDEMNFTLVIMDNAKQMGFWVDNDYVMNQTVTLSNDERIFIPIRLSTVSDDFHLFTFLVFTETFGGIVERDVWYDGTSPYVSLYDHDMEFYSGFHEKEDLPIEFSYENNTFEVTEHLNEGMDCDASIVKEDEMLSIEISNRTLENHAYSVVLLSDYEEVILGDNRNTCVMLRSGEGIRIPTQISSDEHGEIVCVLFDITEGVRQNIISSHLLEE